MDFPIVRHVASKLNKTLSLTVLAVFCTVYTCTVQSMMILTVIDTICKDSLSLFSSYLHEQQRIPCIKLYTLQTFISCVFSCLKQKYLPFAWQLNTQAANHYLFLLNFFKRYLFQPCWSARSIGCDSVMVPRRFRLTHCPGVYITQGYAY